MPTPGPTLPSPRHPGVVAAVIGEGALTFDLAVPCEVFGLDRSDLGVDWYRFLLVSADPSPITTSTGFQLSTPHGLDALQQAGTVIVPGWCDPEVRPSAELVAALTAAHRAGARIVSLCTGAFVLADAGLLDGRRATTHWMYADRLRARCTAEVDPAALYVQDGRRLHLGRHRRRHRPLPAPGPPGPRSGDRQRGRPPPGHTPLP